MRRKRWLVVELEQYIPHRDTGTISAIATSWGHEEEMIERFPGDLIEALDFFLRQKLFDAVMHEVSEAIHYNGKRIFDPHRPEGLGFQPLGDLPSMRPSSSKNSLQREASMAIIVDNATTGHRRR